MAENLKYVLEEALQLNFAMMTDSFHQLSKNLKKLELNQSALLKKIDKDLSSFINAQYYQPEDPENDIDCIITKDSNSNKQKKN